ncbi:unnamed protein product [Nesidiocoris tenuis]|uniref:Uncharacterized protein n=1 Tax=Nesidiocoris tenuis TaxID=355587 RepID=A0A6H5GXW6_9HEMI|nr:unnamed protein product [Nesidiocoris tenuis]
MTFPNQDPQKTYECRCKFCETYQDENFPKDSRTQKISNRRKTPVNSLRTRKSPTTRKFRLTKDGKILEVSNGVFQFESIQKYKMPKNGFGSKPQAMDRLHHQGHVPTGPLLLEEYTPTLQISIRKASMSSVSCNPGSSHRNRGNETAIDSWKMTEEVELLLPPQDLAARRHFFEEVAAGGGNRCATHTGALASSGVVSDSHRQTQTGTYRYTGTDSSGKSGLRCRVLASQSSHISNNVSPIAYHRSHITDHISPITYHRYLPPTTHIYNVAMIGLLLKIGRGSVNPNSYPLLTERQEPLSGVAQFPRIWYRAAADVLLCLRMWTVRRDGNPPGWEPRNFRADLG